MFFRCFKLKKKSFSSLMRIPYGIFGHWKVDEVLIIVSFCIFEILYVFKH